MHTAATLLALASAASAAIQGFNYGSTFTSGAAKLQADFEAEFTTAANLVGTSGWTSARLYTMVQGGSASDPIAAIPAAIKTKTSLLLGLWASGGDTSFANEILALKAAIAQYGNEMHVDGISVGSEDLYRNSPMGIAAKSNIGAEPETIARYIKEVKDTIAGTPLEGSPIGHVDTWTAWDNSTNQIVVDACDWIGMDAYPYFQDTMPNAIGQSKSLFAEALAKTQAASGGKAVWVTETGQPVSGKTVGQSEATVSNAEAYWKTVGCPMFGQRNVWWYTLQDASPDTPNPSFGIVGSTLSTTPLFDLSCDGVDTESSSSAGPSSSASATGSDSSASATETSTGTDSGAAPTETSTGTDTGLAGGSPGGVPSSQISIQQSATVTPPAISSNEPGSGSGSGTGSSGSGTGVGGGSSANGTFTAPPSATSSITQGGAPALQSGGLGAAFLALMAAIFAL
ncbi:Uu.00g017170.m01.CDS01 [Anthostomella pinea]|uniref:Probable glucan endo-1,3-beta-glucosidase eglC n=1 Tax=Anthostomella pinea TaxID=933095 RepID=A0AAI8VYV1_9PEZI|nr:Uu.00g017170.m01.CDS01 [Anthostomella pinea]